MAGGMDVHKNEWVEAWASHRENLEQKFRFNRRSIPVCLLFGLLTPIFTYQFVRDEFHKQDQMAGRAPRKFL
ncbi:hypothetical protein Mp_1g03930 [Marchantia polymorpha subsp. ruderalis]|uniref:NADH dehydrogenase [ubiquinone] 1 beta subcomplex subunit 4 n=2 Tax=Marchantia polymorpha TaxID=3197 RepID=A0AAF6AL97_MARPO|nr:hypothetical protein MARPO_0005s0214 [Marchantia polymorpha]BBM97217.1 hypothetical protein Mp_1g03930 [Marchantia polymorpha subsp. ruderalis]|eukprot:PTQ48591.1 hypothetical protein MARPO_0005s0214 [Marchantia polymorpha]